MLTITLLGTGGPIPDPHRAGPATLVAGVCEAVVDLVQLGDAHAGAANSSASCRVRGGSGYDGSRWAVAPRPSTRRNAPARGLG